MTIQFHATYRDGVLHPDQPLALPDNTEVHVVVVPVVEASKGTILTREEILAMLPKAPRFTAEELHERIAKSAVRVGSLPPDFSREDIYSDHD
jgi:predicted DNA-binding antitoxin AbrB/MazE fold protein